MEKRGAWRATSTSATDIGREAFRSSVNAWACLPGRGIILIAWLVHHRKIRPSTLPVDHDCSLQSILLRTMGSRWALMRSGVIKSTDKNDHGVAHMKVTPIVVRFDYWLQFTPCIWGHTGPGNLTRDSTLHFRLSPARAFAPIGSRHWAISGNCSDFSFTQKIGCFNKRVYTTLESSRLR